MRGYLNNLSRCLAAAAWFALPLCVAHAADLKGARVWAGPDYTRIVLDAEGPVQYKITQQGDQVVVDLTGSRVLRAFSDPAAAGLLKSMSHARVGDSLQLMATVSAGSRLKSFVLKPNSGSQYRLVLDLYPAGTHASASVPALVDAVSAAGNAVSAARTPASSSAPAPVSTPRYSNPTRSGRVAAEQAAAMLNGQRQVVVAIDAGHGGKDQGARGPGGTLEKNVTLSVARDLAAQINKQPGMKAVLTRDNDFYIPLKQRYRIARENNADLFVSIHADSFTSGDAKGSSVWVLSPRGKTSEAARWLADRENRADLIGGTTLDDKDDSLAKVLLDLQQGWAMQASDVVGGNVLKALAALGPTHRGHVERANFVVLRSPDVPSILVETAFISNPAEERRLRDPAHQRQLATAVMSGVKNYFESTPPQGTWFAAQAAKRNNVQLASTVAPISAPGPGSRTGAPSHADSHRVGRGESLGSIARHYGISVGALKNANQMDGNTVHAGTVLTIPTS